MAPTYKIKETVDRSGFSAATLRYYEEIELLPPSPRNSAGYRLYDDRTLERLAFIARAKQLGCTLAEIRGLALAWDGGECGPIQDELRDVVADKLMNAEEQIGELRTLIRDLEQAAGLLEQHRPDGPCDESCGCVSDPAATEVSVPPQAIALTRKPKLFPGLPSEEALAEGLSSTDDVAIACTLGSTSVPDRLGEWRQLLTHVVHRAPLPGGLRATFGPGAPLVDLMRLVAAEQDCCQFFDFSITVDSRGIALEARSPADALPLLESVFGAPA